MYYYYNAVNKSVGYYFDLVDALHGDPRDIEHFNELTSEEEKIIFCEDVNINCYISRSKDDLLEIMQSMLISNFDELKQELLKL